MPVRRIVAPTVELVTLAEAKTHLRVDHNDEDALIASLISAAREQAEHRTERTFLPTTWLHTEDQFPGAIRLRYGRVNSVSAVRYRDSLGALQTLAPSGYTLDNSGDFVGWIYPSAGSSWPATWGQPNGVEVEYIAGQDAVPASVKTWSLLTVGALYANREAGLEKAVSELPRSFYHALLDPYVVPEV